MIPIRQNARDVIVKNYALKDTLPKQIDYINSIIQDYKIHQMQDKNELKI